MESWRSGQPWGKLVKLDSNETVLLFSKECTVGRKKGCYLSFPANKLVSGEHCKIVRDECSGQVWLHDTSTNGTVLNLSQLVKRQSHVLHNEDIIYFVYKKNEPEHNIAYVYHDLLEEQHVPKSKFALKRPVQSPSARPESDQFFSVEPVMLPKAPQYDVQEDPQPSTSASHFCIESASFIPEAVPPSVSGRAEKASPVHGEVEEDILEPERKRRKTSVGRGDCLSSSHTSSVKVVSTEKEKVKNVSSNPPTAVAKVDKMEESLTCVICQDLLHDCISLQPCMHVFCAACYSGWMERSSLCPTCRCPVERICKNHILNNLVEAFLLQHPEKCRSEEDLKNMDNSNKITQDMLQPKVDRSFSDEEGSSDYLFEISDIDNDSDSSDVSQTLMMCRQCPGYRSPVNQLEASSNFWLSSFPAPVPKCPPSRATTERGATRLTEEQPSTSSDVSSVQVPAVHQEYCCPPQSCHLICTCCLQPMPDRRMESNNQHCMLCQQPFCHLYWGCQRMGCQGCLAEFGDLNLTDKCLDGVLNNNTYESEVLQNYLISRGKTWKDLLQDSLQAAQQGRYFLTNGRISAKTVVCFCCGLRAFRELAYHYRQSIPPSELPAAVTSRPDCYWGRNCRTQVKSHHATKFNHICEQTRFKS